MHANKFLHRNLATNGTTHHKLDNKMPSLMNAYSVDKYCELSNEVSIYFFTDLIAFYKEKMYQYIFLIVCSFVGSTVYGCPSSCSCRDTIVWCNNRNLSAIPSDIPHDSTYVSLSKNKITTIDANVFQGMTALQTLFMNENKITTVDANSFQGLTALTLLDLSYNKITKDLKVLTVLDLEDNPLDCSNCELKTIKDFLKNNSNLGDSGAKCGYKLLIEHNFITCKEITTIPSPDSTGVSTDSETTEKSVPTSTTTTTTTTEYQISTVESTTGIINTEVIIYVSCGAGIFLILTCSIICFCVHKKCRKAHIYQNTGINQNSVANNSGVNIDDEVGKSQNVSTGRESGHEYQQIDELEMSDFVLSSNEQRHITVGDNSSNSSDGIQLSTDGYLNPYESLLSTRQQSDNTQDRDSDENTAYSRLYSRSTSEVVDEPI
ncbi:unnamed protein product [Mytilus coruscus]|uniref:LRRNT domain-containing protein n=1 Tax=Mytilus coruscus TaxID=42192 RepID=A0A6J8AXA3_MYTCO|nr:unnamed protein product [Mytilus coruscus]